MRHDVHCSMSANVCHVEPFEGTGKGCGIWRRGKRGDLIASGHSLLAYVCVQWYEQTLNALSLMYTVNLQVLLPHLIGDVWEEGIDTHGPVDLSLLCSKWSIHLEAPF